MKLFALITIPLLIWMGGFNKVQENNELDFCLDEKCSVDYCLDVANGKFLGHFGRWATPVSESFQRLCVEECNYSIAEPATLHSED